MAGSLFSVEALDRLQSCAQVAFCLSRRGCQLDDHSKDTPPCASSGENNTGLCCRILFKDVIVEARGVVPTFLHPDPCIIDWLIAHHDRSAHNY